MHTAVLFLVFNRPDTTRQVFQAIRQARPPRLYIGADGPRDDRPGEKERCDQVRQIATAVDWPCEVKTLFREKNLGCRVGVSTAIDWFFEDEPEGIILEDDCLPDLTFFRFCEELLDRYREETRVMLISGNYFHGNAYTSTKSYFFSRYCHIWGWATWRRAWQYYDSDMDQWPRLRKTDWLRCVGDGHYDFQKYWTRILDSTHAGKIDTWAYRWNFSCWTQNGLAILPSKNLVKNIGFGENATHTKGDGGWISKMPLESITFPLDHPNEIVRDQVADRWTDLNVVKTHVPLIAGRILRKFQTLARLITSFLRPAR